MIEYADHKSAKFYLQHEGLSKSVEKNSKWRHSSPYEIHINHLMLRKYGTQ